MLSDPIAAPSSGQQSDQVSSVQASSVGPVDFGRGAAVVFERRDRIRERVETDGFASVTELADVLGVSGVTVRSDLDALAADGVLQRVRGGAVPRTPRATERSFEEGLAAAAGEKRAIATTAAASVLPGESVILDVGTTTAAIAAALVAREDLVDVTVITNGLSIALVLEAAIPRFTVIVTGGTLRPLQHSLVEPLASEMFERIRADVAFIGCTGVDAGSGVTNVNLPEAALKRTMLRSARRRVAVADSRKLGIVDLGRVAGLDEFDRLLTGSVADAAVVRDLEAAGLAVTLCAPDPVAEPDEPASL
ncbi:DeoR/GlpR transcriptional regulator [Microbacteriaceae bacterium VKM Ac-2855]|nr:DeoR/GlpR transcriptional regulator [Microbacteriaceae bacterium VKM Ac-2855]